MQGKKENFLSSTEKIKGVKEKMRSGLMGWEGSVSYVTELLCRKVGEPKSSISSTSATFRLKVK